MANERRIGNPRIYKVDKTKCETHLDEIEVQMLYFPECSAGRGFYAHITPQKRENHGSYDTTVFDFWDVKVHKLLGAARYAKKAEAEALKILQEFEPYWVAQLAASLGLVLEHDPIHGNW